MPIIAFEPFSKNFIWGIWKIEETEGDLLKELFDEQEDLKGITSEKRRLQTLAGRLLVKQLLLKANLNFNGLIKTIEGKPYAKDGNYYVSISHTEELCVAIIHTVKSVGIDIESVREKFWPVAPKFLNNQELLLFGNNIKQLCICWCVKEVVYKIHGLKTISLKDNINIISYDKNLEEGVIIAELKTNNCSNIYQIKFLKYHSFYIAYNL